MPIGIKFSQFISGGNLKVTDKTVGVRDGLNTIFTDPSDGILDENGNYLLRYASGSLSAVNAVLFKNAATGEPAEITVGGSDSDASLKIYSKANGSLILETPSEGDIILRNIGNGSIDFISSGLGNINFSTNSGEVIINETTGINAILDEDNMVSNSATAVPTQQSVKAYVDSSVSALELTWSVVTGTSQTAVGNNGYIANNAGTVTVTLPAAAAVGATFAVTGINNATGWRLAVDSGQTLYLGTAATTTGTGYLESTNTRDSVTVICVVANTTFQAINSIGNITVV